MTFLFSYFKILFQFEVFLNYCLQKTEKLKLLPPFKLKSY